MKVEKEGVHHKKYEGHYKNNELEFQRLLEHHPLYKEDPYVEYPLIKHL